MYGPGGNAAVGATLRTPPCPRTAMSRAKSFGRWVGAATFNSARARSRSRSISVGFPCGRRRRCRRGSRRRGCAPDRRVEVVACHPVGEVGRDDVSRDAVRVLDPSPISRGRLSRRATSTTSWPSSANRPASGRPIPADAPATSAVPISSPTHVTRAHPRYLVPRADRRCRSDRTSCFAAAQASFGR